MALNPATTQYLQHQKKMDKLSHTIPHELDESRETTQRISTI